MNNNSFTKILSIIICVIFIPIFLVIIVPNINNDDNRKPTTKIEEKSDDKMNSFHLIINNTELAVNVENNSSVDALLERLEDGNIVINAHDYGNFEKVGDLGFELPRNDKNYTTKPGDIILYQGSYITIYYDTNTYNFTKLGEIININEKELKDLLGDGDVTITIRGVND